MRSVERDEIVICPDQSAIAVQNESGQYHCSCGGSASSGGKSDIDMDERHDTRAFTMSVWVYGDGNDTKAVKGDDLELLAWLTVIAFELC